MQNQQDQNDLVSAENDKEDKEQEAQGTGMILLDKSYYGKIIKLLEGVTINKLFAVVVAEDKVSGEIYVDNKDNPTTVYIRHPYGMSLLFGSTENAKFNEKFAEYLVNKDNARDKTEWMQTFPDDLWCNMMGLMIGKNLTKKNSSIDFAITNDELGNVVENTRVNFIFNQRKYEQVKIQWVDSKSYQIVELDENIYTEEVGSVVPRYFWNNAEQFVKNGKGFALLCNGMVASIAFSSFIVDKMLEIGIETKAEFRGRGLASIVCSRLIEYCLDNGYEPVWSCRFENNASFKVAQKLGFEPVKYLPYYKLNGVPQKAAMLKIEDKGVESSFLGKQESKLSDYYGSFVTNIGQLTNTPVQQDQQKAIVTSSETKLSENVSSVSSLKLVKN